MKTPEERASETDSTEPHGGDDRRRWPRIVNKDRSRVWFSTAARGAQYGQLQDISLGGLAICVPDASQLQPGGRVVVGLSDWLIPATVKHVAGNPKKGYRVGIEWVRAGSAAVTSLVDQYRQAAELSGTIAVEGTPEYEDALSAQS